MRIIFQFGTNKTNIAKRPKRWDIIGTAWKWIAGNPALRTYGSSTKAPINWPTRTTIKSKPITKSAKEPQISQHYQSSNRKTTDQSNHPRWTRHHYHHPEHRYKILNSIQEAILFSKIHVTNSKWLSSKEMHLIKNILINKENCNQRIHMFQN